MEDIQKHLLEFDRKRGWNEFENFKKDGEMLRYLMDMVVHLVGELGEFANNLKKFQRDGTWDERKLKEELVDTFTMVVKIANALKIDLKKEYFEKMKYNEKRFKHFIRE